MKESKVAPTIKKTIDSAYDAIEDYQKQESNLKEELEQIEEQIMSLPPKKQHVSNPFFNKLCDQQDALEEQIKQVQEKLAKAREIFNRL